MRPSPGRTHSLPPIISDELEKKMQSIQRNTMEQLSGGSADFVDWLRNTFVTSDADEPDRWIYEEINYNAQY
jgi:hypothetical protein